MTVAGWILVICLYDAGCVTVPPSMGVTSFRYSGLYQTQEQCEAAAKYADSLPYERTACIPVYSRE